MEHETSRRCLPDNFHLPYYYGDRYATPALPRYCARSYPMGGPVGGVVDPANFQREEPPMDGGPARRRIAVACARCRKRKIRCSGDPGNGSGCVSCRQAGVDPTLCVFHRVGSDNVTRVMDTFNLANSLSILASGDAIVPFPTANNGMFPRTVPTNPYPPVDTRPVYPSTWTVPNSEETSPVESYPIDQQGPFLPAPTPNTSANMGQLPYRCSYPVSKSLHDGVNQYYNADASLAMSGLPYLPADSRGAAADTLVSLNMSSLHLSLPDRLPQAHFNTPDSTVPQRQLPMPMPSAAQNTRNDVDKMQDQRLRSSLGGHSSGPMPKPLVHWSAELDSSGGSATLSDHRYMTSTNHLPGLSDDALTYSSRTSSISDGSTTVSTAPQMRPDFGAPLLEPLSLSAPAAAQYSNFREWRGPPTAPVQPTARVYNQTNGFGSDAPTKQEFNATVPKESKTCISGWVDDKPTQSRIEDSQNSQPRRRRSGHRFSPTSSSIKTD